MTIVDNKSQLNKYRPWIVSALAFILISFVFYRVVDPTEKLQVYQERWGPALAFACTGRIGVIDLQSVSAKNRAITAEKIGSFLSRKPTPSFSCSDFPPDASVLPYEAEGNHIRFFHRFQIGLHLLVGLLWGVFGPSWKIVGLVSACFAAGTSIALYATARLFTGRIQSLIITFLAVSSSVHLEMIPVTRDYAKTFFVIVSFWALLMLLMRQWSSFKLYITYIFAFGLFLGIGLGFRQDISSIFAISAVMIAIFQQNFRKKSVELSKYYKFIYFILPVVAFVAAFLIFAVPIYRIVPVEIGHEGHFLILGLFSGAFLNSGWSTGDVIFNPSYQDFSAYTLIQAYTIAKTGDESVKAFSYNYNALSISQFFDYLYNYPFYIIGRIYSISIDIISLSLYSLKLNGYGFGLKFIYLVNSISVMFVIFQKNRRLFLFIILLLFGVSAVLSIQYMERHYFHVHLFWFVMSLSISVGLLFEIISNSFAEKSVITSKFFTASKSQLIWSKKISWFYLPLIAWVMLAVFVLSWVMQSAHSKTWRENLYAQPVTAAVFTQRAVEQNLAYELGGASFVDFRGKLFDFAAAKSQPIGEAVGGYIEVRFKPAPSCTKNKIKLSIMYNTKYKYFDLSHDVLILLDDTRQTSHFAPVFFTKESFFERFVLSQADAVCLDAIFWVNNFQAIALPVEFTDKR